MPSDYELMYIVRPEADEEGVKNAIGSVQSLIESNGGEVVKTSVWGKRKLAYEVQRQREGHYVLVHLRLDGTKVVDVERSLRIHDAVFRHLLVVHDGKTDIPDEPADGGTIVAGDSIPDEEVIGVADINGDELDGDDDDDEDEGE